MQTPEILKSHRKNFSPPEKNFVPNDSGDLVMFTPDEFDFFKSELEKMQREGKNLDFAKATRNARYLAELKKGFDEMKAGGGTTVTFDELEKIIA